MSIKHLTLILDGFGYNAWKTAKDRGIFGYIDNTAKVIATYPSMTDLCLNDMLGGDKCRGLESTYFEPRKNRKTIGFLTQLFQENLPAKNEFDYKAPIYWDPITYLAPEFMFDLELKNLKKKLIKTDKEHFIAYFISSAGISTKFGFNGQLLALEKLDKLCKEVFKDIEVRITVTADHGHAYTPPKLINFNKLLHEKGWRASWRIRNDNDVIYLNYGVVLYTSFMTKQPEKLAMDLLTIQGVRFASFKKNGIVSIINGAGETRIRKNGSGYAYEIIQGDDPLNIYDKLTTLQKDADGFMESNLLLEAMDDNDFPDAIDRIWRAHHDLVKNTPDVIVELEDEYAGGPGSLYSIARIFSTHGNLNKINSTTFAADTHLELPKLLRTRDLLNIIHS